MQTNVMLVGAGSEEVLQKITIFFIPLLPLIGAIFLGLSCFYRSKLSEKLSGVLATTASLGSFILVFSSFKEIHSLGIKLGFNAWSWISTGNLNVDFGLMMDNLSGCLLYTSPSPRD